MGALLAGHAQQSASMIQGPMHASNALGKYIAQGDGLLRSRIPLLMFLHSVAGVR